MHLTKEEERILSGEDGFAKQKAMQILVAIGKTYNAEKLIPITSAHISGVSYKNIGEAGLEFLQDLANNWAKVVVKTTLNPGGAAPEMGLPRDFILKQKQVVDAYKALGIEPTLSCTPYLTGNLPKKGDHVAWSESSAVVYINSIIGAYTNREGGPSALAAALIGKTPEHGMHLDENRKAEVTVRVTEKLFGFQDFAALGYYTGTTFKEKIVSFDFHSRPNNENLKGLSAAIAASGSAAMFKLGREGEEVVEVGYDEIDTTFQKFNSALKPDLIAIGCPHASTEEVKKIARMLKGKHVNPNITFWVFTSEFVKKELEHDGYEETLNRAGAKLITSTCMVVSPLEELGFRCMATNSAKAAHYARSLCNVETKLMSLEEIVKYSTK
jgi:predicted aconitase